MVSLASCSLITVCSYSCLTLLLLVLGVKLYSFVMVKAGKAEAGSDPLAKVTKFYVWFDFYKINYNLCDSCNGYMIFLLLQD